MEPRVGASSRRLPRPAGRPSHDIVRGVHDRIVIAI